MVSCCSHIAGGVDKGAECIEASCSKHWCHYTSSFMQVLYLLATRGVVVFNQRIAGHLIAGGSAPKKDWAEKSIPNTW